MQQVRVTDLPALLASFDEGARPVVLDVREPWEMQAASLALDGAPTVCIPMNEVPARLAELDPAQPVLSLCHHGMRSLQVGAFLERQGFDQVFNIAGGIDAWSREVDASVPLY
ncbi:rhodanese-like domain-containing protein [Piscinibacter gummiphilus]|uniref:Sulfurtransferase n=1 Tax=Piscinibacter gummiphilus TaxID=946333 RepID=A0A1W6L8J5_9BURK|nr:rhodanese-like domain-containing protein [Piscinibacter gummiphilus]ARN20544.1 sulfurtransferase [Piscinibacter gummiphilus]ATU65220.1 sulfurtransferase [Piscinibacter gummiphilus]GLS98376.1 rhodanese-like domain-containing protein [Piscinibacter gummiphilus]